MNNVTSPHNPLVYTIKDRCKMCYTCVRECPAKAIRIIEGQAEVIYDRCIGCGNCVKVCTRKAKNFRKTHSRVQHLLHSDKPSIALVAPSFPAEFNEFADYRTFVGLLKKTGFEKVVEVSFGADLVAKEYKAILTSDKNKRYISSDCPAIVEYIRKYHPALINNLAPVVSPVMALARVLREEYHDKYNLVFIGPCIAKKEESKELDEVITFSELREFFESTDMGEEAIEKKDFDQPHSGRGAIFPVSRGLIQTMNMQENLITGNVVVAEGRENFKEALQEFDNGLINDHHLELLCCEGCIMGAGMSGKGKRYENSAYITKYVKNKLHNLDISDWQKYMDTYKNLDLSRYFETDDQRVKLPSSGEIQEVWKAMGKTSPEDRLDCHACGYESCEEHAIAVCRGLAEYDMCLPYTIEKLHHSVEQLNEKNEHLSNMKQALRQSEKLAHLGQLSAGIAHELNNPLGVVIMYSNMLLDETDESNENYDDYKMITDQALRCKKIVGDLLNFARKNQVKRNESDIADLIKQSINALLIPENVNIRINNKLKNPKLLADGEQLIQAFSNLIKNGIEAMPDGGKLEIILNDDPGTIYVNLTDEGFGIPEENREKVFTPFFTTKGIGKGTGLGLPTIYGIIKMHKGKINFKSNTDPEKGKTGTCFTLEIPRNL
jgi:iron only hydrogenase large subunit-like protein/nitrogen-specific signal transduction histidine kinase